jgi:hypothetical protein
MRPSVQCIYTAGIDTASASLSASSSVIVDLHVTRMVDRHVNHDLHNR